MDTDRLNRWLTLGANLAVLAGILFLALEIRQNNELLQAQSAYNNALNRTTIPNILMTAPDMAEFLAKVERGDELTLADQIRARAYALSLFGTWNYDFYEIQAGRLVIDKGLSDHWHGIFHSGFLPNPGLPGMWEEVKGDYSDDFVTFMEENVVK